MASPGDGDGDGEPGDGEPGDGDGEPGDGDDDSGDGDGDGDSSDGDGDGDGDCMPGEIECLDLDNTQTCNDRGQWDPPQPCDPGFDCLDGGCLDISSCEFAEANPSHLGCSFLFTTLDHVDTNVQAILIVNPSNEHAAQAELYRVPVNGMQEQLEGQPFQLDPYATMTRQLDPLEVESVTTIRQGGVYRLESDRPVAVFLHTPPNAVFDNEASLLLPDWQLCGGVVPRLDQRLSELFPAGLRLEHINP